MQYEIHPVTTLLSCHVLLLFSSVLSQHVTSAYEHMKPASAAKILLSFQIIAPVSDICEYVLYNVLTYILHGTESLRS